jgi:hypothetical protein
MTGPFSIAQDQYDGFNGVKGAVRTKIIVRVLNAPNVYLGVTVRAEPGSASQTLAECLCNSKVTQLESRI